MGLAARKVIGVIADIVIGEAFLLQCFGKCADVYDCRVASKKRDGPGTTTVCALDVDGMGMDTWDVYLANFRDGVDRAAHK